MIRKFLSMDPDTIILARQTYMQHQVSCCYHNFFESCGMSVDPIVS